VRARVFDFSFFQSCVLFRSCARSLFLILSLSLSLSLSSPLSPPSLFACPQARKNRPKKSCLSDINRKPPPYDVEPMIAARKTIKEYEKIGEVSPFVFMCLRM